MTARSSMRSVASATAVTLVALITVLAPGSPATAHTELESSSPADGATVTTPVSSVSLTFNQGVDPTANPVQLLDEQGTAVATTGIEQSPDRTVVTVRTLAPLANGRYGVAWEVVSADGHPVSGTFSFVIDAPVPTTTTVAPTTTSRAPTTTRAPATTAAPDTTSAPSTTQPPDTTPAPTTPTTDPGAAVPPDDGHSSHGDGSHVSSPLDEALAQHQHDAGGQSWWSTPARIMVIGGAVLTVGMVAFVVMALGGQVVAAAGVLRWARVAGVVVVAGAVLDALGHADSLGIGTVDGLQDVLDGSLGIATALRLAGGAAIALSWAKSTATTDRLSADDGRGRNRGAMTIPAMLGVAALVLSFSFDGHTVTEGNRLVHSAVNAVHVGAAAVWAGGAIALLLVLFHIRRSARISPTSLGAAAATTTFGAIPSTKRVDSPVDPLRIGLRFSSMATVALVAVALAGTAMALMVLSSLGDLFGTEWGQTLLIKLGATAVAATFGAFNHFVALRRLERQPHDPAVRGSLRLVLIGEAVALTVVIVVTSFLVAASPT